MMRSDYDETKEGAGIVTQAISAAVLLLAAMLLAFLISSRAFAMPVEPNMDNGPAQAKTWVEVEAADAGLRAGMLR